MSDLKKVLQAIEIGDPKEWVGTLWGEKTVSVREGPRDYHEGPVILISPDGSQSVQADLIKSRRCIINDVNNEELAGDWYRSKDHMIDDLGIYYSDIGLESEITVPMWKNVNGLIVPTERPKKLRIYLSHPSTMKEQVREWELDFNKRHGEEIEIINPLSDKYSSIPFHEEDSQLEREARVAKDSGKIVDHEKELMPNVHATVAVHNGDFTVGSPQEQYHSYVTLWKPTYSLVLNGRENSPWIKEHSDMIFTDWKELEQHLSLLKGLDKNYFYRGDFLDYDQGSRIKKN